VVGSCQYGNEISGSIQGRECLNNMSHCQLLNTNSDPWSWLVCYGAHQTSSAFHVPLKFNFFTGLRGVKLCCQMFTKKIVQFNEINFSFYVYFSLSVGLSDGILYTFNTPTEQSQVITRIT
jgi:hypothetical protein